MINFNIKTAVRCGDCNYPLVSSISRRIGKETLLDRYPDLELTIDVFPCNKCQNRLLNTKYETLTSSGDKLIRRGMVFKWTRNNLYREYFLTLFQTDGDEFMFFDTKTDMYNRWDGKKYSRTTTLNDMAKEGFEFVSEPEVSEL